MDTIHGLLERNAEIYPDKEAFITKTDRLTYAAMNQRTNQIARFLSGRGVAKESRIAIAAKNDQYFLYAFFSLLKLGAIPMPINNKLTQGEIHTILQNAEADGILYDADFAEKVESFSIKWRIQEIDQESREYQKHNLNLLIGPQDTCEILFTSGTTGVPKGVVFTHERILALAYAMAVELEFTSDDRILTIMPLSHSAPLNCFFIGPLYMGASFIIDDFTPKALLKWVSDEKTTFTFAAPVAYLLASKEKNISEYDLSSMRSFAYGGSAMPLATYESVAEAFQNQNFYQVYGLTEAGPNGCLLRPHEHLEKRGSIGKNPVINMEMKIIRKDGAETDAGEYGEILLRGSSLMIGYYNQPAATEEVVKDGWLYTGDIAYKDPDGYIYIVDRKKDVIIPGGINVYPREIEEVLARHPAIHQACVVGVPHADWGETVKAVIVLNEGKTVTEEEVKWYLSESLAEFKIPRLFSFVKELPYSASGKLLKQKVKEM
ncbi:class I adenylate-forming enzyme family protein [Peribacillus kribbensis]|uniref:class I adenylate-forming enzyme family protein n=1 Tax=Peribacillus kribbensis TaxID=356658 RepID=UPI000419F583|nr:AMP-binding protein [Peribacillus kribbensis]